MAMFKNIRAEAKSVIRAALSEMTEELGVSTAFKAGESLYYVKSRHGCYEGSVGFGYRLEDSRDTPYPEGSKRAQAWTQGFLTP